jgi:hypothetical protein
MRGDLDLALEQEYEPPGTTHRCRFSVGGVSVQLLAARNSDVMLGPLEPFRVEQPVSDIQIRIEWASSLPLPGGPQAFDSGSVWRLYDDGPGFQFDFSTPQLGERSYKRLFVDRQFRDAKLYLNRECFADSDDAVDCMEYPLDELLIMHRLTQERAIELHGSGIVCANGVGNLFVGHSGAGKSTTTRLWTSREEVEVLSDDRIIVRPDQPRDGHSDLSAPGPMRMYGTPWHGEAMFASPNSAPLTRIFILEHGHGNVITRLTPSQAVGELFARAFVPFHRHEYIDNAITFLEQLVASVPCYRYSFEPDERAVEKIQHFND